MASSRRVSIGSMELDINKARWNLQNKCVEDATFQLEENNMDAAMELCNKALEQDANFFPALSLKKRIEKSRHIATANEQDDIPTLRVASMDDILSSSDSDSNSSSGSRRVAFSVKPVTPKTPKGILKNGESSGNCMVSRSTSFPSKSYNHSELRRDSQGKQKKLEKLLIQSHGFLISSADLLESAIEFQNQEDKDFECPKCRKGFDKAHTMLAHFVKLHFPSFSGKELKPFACKTCHKRFLKGSELLVHATTDHPTCLWLDRFQTLINNCGKA